MIETDGDGDIPATVKPDNVFGDLPAIRQHSPSSQKVSYRPSLRHLQSLTLPGAFRNPFQLRTLMLILMQLMTVLALISYGVFLYRDLKWNRILDGSNLVSFPDTQNTWVSRFISFDDLDLLSLLHRPLTMPVIGIVLLIVIFIFNVIAQVFDWRNLHLFLASLVYSIFCVALISLAAGEIYFVTHSSRRMYEKAADRLLELVPLDEDVVPYMFPPGNPIFVRLYPQYFLQVMYSCNQGSVLQWERTSELMGVFPSAFRIPTYRQLVQMGFCINYKSTYTLVVLLFVLALLAVANMVLCLKIWRFGVLVMVQPMPQIKLAQPSEKLHEVKNKMDETG